jgi:hypothetical protein
LPELSSKEQSKDKAHPHHTTQVSQSNIVDSAPPLRKEKGKEHLGLKRVAACLITRRGLGVYTRELMMRLRWEFDF